MDNNQKLWEKVKHDIGITSNRKILLSDYYSYALDTDIKHLNFVLSRYKFASKMAENKPAFNLLELGCSFGLGAKFFSQLKNFNRFVGVDFDKQAIDWANETFATDRISFLYDNFLGKDYRALLSDNITSNGYDVIVSIDVIEHIENEGKFLETLRTNISDDGIAIIGTPNITMNAYASAGSKVGHVNLFDQKRLHSVLSKVFQNVFIFGMTDEVIHTGFYPMCCYIMAVCAGKNNKVS